MLQPEGFDWHAVVYDRVPHREENVPFVGDGVSFIDVRSVCLQETQAEGVLIDSPRRSHSDDLRDMPCFDVSDEYGNQIMITDVV